MALISDGLLIVTALSAGLYCLVLSRRLRRLTDSGDGIGAQIEALDQALAGTRAALDETGARVGELRGSAKVSLDELARAAEAGGALTERLEQATRRAESALQRLYQAAHRVEAHDARQDPGADAGAGPEAVETGSCDIGPAGLEPPGAGARTFPGPGEASGPDAGPDTACAGASDELELLELPVGTLRAAGRAGASAPAEPDDPAGAAAPSETAARKRGGGEVLKVERVML